MVYFMMWRKLLHRMKEVCGATSHMMKVCGATKSTLSKASGNLIMSVVIDVRRSIS